MNDDRTPLSERPPLPEQLRSELVELLAEALLKDLERFPILPENDETPAPNGP
jgi:hypothetical protein